MSVASAAPAAAGDETALEVRAVDESAAGEWDRFVADCPAASFYHRYGWRSVIRDVFRRETHYLAAYDAGRIAGVLPLVRLKSRLVGDFLVSMPYLNYGGVAATTTAAANRLVEHAGALAARLGVSHVELRHRASQFPDMPVRTDKVTMLLPMPATSEALWKAIGAKARGQINQARRAEARCIVGHSELLREFYTVFSENMRDLGTPVYPLRFFESIAATFKDAVTVIVVRLGERPVAGCFLIDDGHSIEIPWASSLRRRNPWQVNMLLYWHALEFTVQRNRAVFDFGRCTIDSGTYAFKKKWGAKPAPLYWHYWMREGSEPPRINPSNPKFALAVALWKRLPLFVANRLGPRLIGNLP